MLSAQALEKIDQAIAKYPSAQKQSAVMAALTIAQQEKKWLDTATIEYIAQYLSMPAIWVQEVATFYHMYHTKEVGTHTITVCTNLPCMLGGSEETVQSLKDALGIDFNETTPCKTFTLKEGECMGACGDAPVLLLNNHQMHSFMCASKVKAWLTQLNDMQIQAGTSSPSPSSI